MPHGRRAGSDLLLERRLRLLFLPRDERGDGAAFPEIAQHPGAGAEIALEDGRIVVGHVAEELERMAELLGEERRDGVVPLVRAGEDVAERRAVVGGVRPVLDPPAAPEDGVVELGHVADRVDTRA